MMRILLIEDSVRLADTLAEILKQENFQVDIVYDGQDGYDYASTQIYDLILLDVMLPKMNGYEVLKKLRQKEVTTPVLILSAKSEQEDKIEGFLNGADDYVTKPFDVSELLLRINAILRRSKSPVSTENLSCGNLVLNTLSCELKNSETSSFLHLSKTEYQLMEELLHHQNQVLSKDQLITKVWGYDSEVEENSVEVYISFLRKKMKLLNVNAKISAKRGLGYYMEETNDTTS